MPGCDWVVNPYVGCGHNCSYCYARFISRWRGHGEWGGWVEVKMNASELIKDKYVPGSVFMSLICDAYQPIEKDLKLTRKVLENMDKNINLSILTKSVLVLRDVDLLKKFNNIDVGFTINSFEGKAKKLFEPDSPSWQDRVKAMKKLKENGIKTYAFVSPIIPELIDIEKVIAETKDYADHYWFEFINMRGAGKEFTEMLSKEFPESYKIVKNKALFEDFVDEVKRLANNSRIKVKGIEIH